jgi:hypothetical protein
MEMKSVEHKKENDHVGELLLREKRKSGRRSSTATEAIKRLSEKQDYTEVDGAYFFETIINNQMNWLNHNYDKLDYYLIESGELVNRMRDTDLCAHDLDVDLSTLNDEQRAFLDQYDIDDRFFDDCLTKVILIRIKNEKINALRRKHAAIMQQINREPTENPKSSFSTSSSQFIKDPIEVTHMLHSYFYNA